MKSKLYWTLGAVALAGASYAVLHDPQPTTHNGLVRVPTGNATIDAKNALEDAQQAYELHEEARMNGEYDKARFYQEAAEAAISIGNRASFEATSDLLSDAEDTEVQLTNDLDELEQVYDDAISAIDSGAPSSVNTSNPQMLSGLRYAAESLEWSCQNTGANCQAAEISRKHYEDALMGL